MSAQQWQRLESQVVGDYGVFRVVRHRSRSPRDGSVHEFHVLDVPPAVVVIALTGDGRVVMVEQYRHGSENVELEFPAGFIDEGEDAVDAALRELEEETGYCAGAAVRLVQFLPDPAKQTEPVQLVVARECTPVGERDQDGGEDVHTRLVRVDEVPELLRGGHIRSATDVAAWALFRLDED
jgi:ADP-ribose pyrophosphatase